MKGIHKGRPLYIVTIQVTIHDNGIVNKINKCRGGPKCPPLNGSLSCGLIKERKGENSESFDKCVR